MKNVFGNLCLRQVISEVKPEEKKMFISELQKNQKVVVMVGDGINDAAALASADIGIAMGEGVGAASDVSSIVLMGNRLSQVPKCTILVVVYLYLLLFLMSFVSYGQLISFDFICTSLLSFFLIFL